MRARTMAVLAVTGWWILACGGGDEPAEVADAEEADGDGEAAPAELEPGKLHLEYPTVATDAVAGQFVLAPSRDALEHAVAEGGGTFLFYGATMVEPGEIESKVKSLAGNEFTIPNSLVVPIDQGYAAQVGDVLLGHWESGSGMRRAIVTGGTPTAPVVRYLDRAYDKEHEAEQAEDTFEADRFEPLTEAWQIGTTVACGDADDRDHGVLVHQDGDTLLVSGFASKLEVFERSACAGLAPRGEFAPGDAVWVPVVGKFNAGTVTSVDASVGRIWVKYQWGGEEKEEAFPIVDVTKGFDEGDASGGKKGGKGGAKADGPKGDGGGRPARNPDRKVRRPGTN